MSKKLKILLIAGHGAGDPGASSSYGIEADENRRVLEGIKGYLSNYDTSVDIYPINRNCYADIGNNCLQVNFANYDYVFEIHFNSAANVSATGVEVWVTNAEQGISVEQAVVNKVAALGYPNRGVKREDFRVIRTAKSKGVSAALIETCFISNQGDMNRYNSNFYKVCNAIVEGIADGFKLEAVKKVVEIDEMSWDGTAKVDHKVTAYAHSTDPNVLYKYFYEIDGQWTTLTDWQELNRVSFKPKKAGRYKIVCHVKYKTNNTDKEDAYNYFNLDVADKPFIYKMEVDGKYYGQNDIETILKAVDKEMKNGKNITLKKV